MGSEMCIRDSQNRDRSMTLSGQKELWRLGEMRQIAQFGKKDQGDIRIARKLMGIRIRGRV